MTGQTYMLLATLCRYVDCRAPALRYWFVEPLLNLLSRRVTVANDATFDLLNGVLLAVYYYVPER